MRVNRCAACAADRARQENSKVRTGSAKLAAVHFQPESEVACARLRSTRLQWWEREPGYFADEVAAIRRANRRPPSPLPPLPRIKPLPEYTPREILAELARQSKRLAAAQVGDFSGPDAAEQWVTFRRTVLGLDTQERAA